MLLKSLLSKKRTGYFSHSLMPEGEVFSFFNEELVDYRVNNIIQYDDSDETLEENKELAEALCLQLERQYPAGFYETDKYGTKYEG